MATKSNTTQNIQLSMFSEKEIDIELSKADALLKDFPAETVMIPEEIGADKDEGVFVHYNGLNIRFARNEKVRLRQPIIEILEQAGMRVLRMNGAAAASMR